MLQNPGAHGDNLSSTWHTRGGEGEGGRGGCHLSSCTGIYALRPRCYHIAAGWLAQSNTACVCWWEPSIDQPPFLLGCFCRKNTLKAPPTVEEINIEGVGAASSICRLHVYTKLQPRAVVNPAELGAWQLHGPGWATLRRRRDQRHRCLGACRGL